MEVARHWRLKAQRYRLEGSACPICGQVSFPPRPVCPRCIPGVRRITSEGLSNIAETYHNLDTVVSKG